jgi:hypothetical protein
MKTQRLIASAIGWLVLTLGTAAGLAADEKEKGTPEAPASAKAVAGAYYRGDGLGDNALLTLDENGKYAAEWYGCLGKYGEELGTWSLRDNRIALKSSEEDKVKGYRESFDVLRFKGDWILVSTEKRAHKVYEKWGVTGRSCFQKRDRIK